MTGAMRSVDLSNPEIQEAWQDVRNDASGSNWFVPDVLGMPCKIFVFCSIRILVTYGDAGDIVLSGKGSGGLAEMRNHLNNNQVFFGVLRVRAVDDHGSKRAKFVFVTFVGAGVVGGSVRYVCYRPLASIRLAASPSCSCFDS